MWVFGIVFEVFYCSVCFYTEQSFFPTANPQFTFAVLIKTGNFDLYYQLPDRNLEIVCIHINKDVLWLGTTTNGVYCLNIDKKELTHPIQKGNITSFLVITVYFILFADKKSVIVIDAVDIALY